MTVTIYGSYHPKKEKDSLIDCKTALIADGYQQAKLVTDYPTTGSALDASKECLLYSDVNFLVFTKGGKRLGLVRELTFIATDERMRTKVDHCVVFDEFKKTTSIPKLSSDDIVNARIPQRTFTRLEELKEIMVKEAFWHLRRLAAILRSRT